MCIGGGRLVIGQEQDDLDLSFNGMESFIGQLANLNVWSYVLLPHEVQAMHNFCDDFSGDVVSWAEFKLTVT